MAKEASQDGGSGNFTAISVADLFQVGGVIFSTISAFVFAATARARIVTILIAFAAVLLSGALYLLIFKHEKWRSPRVVIQVLLAIAMAIAATVYANQPTQSTGTYAAPDGGTITEYIPASSNSAPVPSIQKIGYVLRPSSSVLTNTQDKVDLDTGCPGWGDMYPHIGPSRCGNLADLVIDPDSLHDANGQPDIVITPPGTIGAYSSCRSFLAATPDNAVNSIQAASLHAGEVLCVKTDTGSTAVVRLENVATNGAGQLTSITIDFQVWTE